MAMGQCILDLDQAKEVLLYLYKKRGYSVRKLAQMLEVGKSTVHRIIQGKQEPPGIVRVRLCNILSEEELLQILKGRQILLQHRIIDEEGRLNKPLVLAIIDALMQDEVAKNEVLGYLLKYYKQELMERLAETLPKIELRWTPSFEAWLTEKKSRPISQRTLNDYKNYWFLCLEGKVLGWRLIKQLSSNRMLCKDGEYHPVGWLRQVFRHYIRYLYAEGRLDWDTYTRLLLTVPGRRYGRKILQKPIKVEDVKRTLLTLREKRADIYTLYLFMLYSATRFEHSLRLFRDWSPDVVVYVPYLNRNVRRLECPSDSFCRYYMGEEHARKPIGFAYFPKYLLPYIEKYRTRLPNRRRVEKVVAKNGGLMPKYIRIFALRQMKVAIGDNDTYKFIVSKFGELSVSARHYMDLLSEADTLYPKYLKHIYMALGDVVRAEI